MVKGSTELLTYTFTKLYLTLFMFVTGQFRYIECQASKSDQLIDRKATIYHRNGKSFHAFRVRVAYA